MERPSFEKFADALRVECDTRGRNAQRKTEAGGVCVVPGLPQEHGQRRRQDAGPRLVGDAKFTQRRRLARDLICFACRRLSTLRMRHVVCLSCSRPAPARGSCARKPTAFLREVGNPWRLVAPMLGATSPATQNSNQQLRSNPYAARVSAGRFAPTRNNLYYAARTSRQTPYLYASTYSLRRPFANKRRTQIIPDSPP